MILNCIYENNIKFIYELKEKETISSLKNTLISILNNYYKKNISEIYLYNEEEYELLDFLSFDIIKYCKIIKIKKKDTNSNVNNKSDSPLDSLSSSKLNNMTPQITSNIDKNKNSCKVIKNVNGTEIISFLKPLDKTNVMYNTSKRNDFINNEALNKTSVNTVIISNNQAVQNSDIEIIDNTSITSTKKNNSMVKKLKKNSVFSETDLKKFEKETIENKTIPKSSDIILKTIIHNSGQLNYNNNGPDQKFNSYIAKMIKKETDITISNTELNKIKKELNKFKPFKKLDKEKTMNFL